MTTAKPTLIAVSGAAGRIGQELINIILDHPATKLVAAIEAPQHPAIGKQAAEGILYTATYQADWEQIDVLIDFSTPDSTAEHLEKACETSTAIVIGTTGLDQSQQNLIINATSKIAVLQSPNMSLGVNVLFALVEKAAAYLHEWDVEIFDLHHRNKLDAPSGTALKLGEIVMQNRPGSKICNNRTGHHQPRQKNEIGMAVMRAGDACGDHSAFFVGNSERIELTHRSSSRKNYANGALAAALFLATQSAGSYSMTDVLVQLQK